MRCFVPLLSVSSLACVAEPQGLVVSPPAVPIVHIDSAADCFARPTIVVDQVAIDASPSSKVPDRVEYIDDRGCVAGRHTRTREGEKLLRESFEVFEAGDAIPTLSAYFPVRLTPFVTDYGFAGDDEVSVTTDRGADGTIDLRIDRRFEASRPVEIETRDRGGAILGAETFFPSDTVSPPSWTSEHLEYDDEGRRIARREVHRAEGIETITEESFGFDAEGRASSTSRTVDGELVFSEERELADGGLTERVERLESGRRTVETRRFDAAGRIIAERKDHTLDGLAEGSEESELRYEGEQLRRWTHARRDPAGRILESRLETRSPTSDGSHIVVTYQQGPEQRTYAIWQTWIDGAGRVTRELRDDDADGHIDLDVTRTYSGLIPRPHTERAIYHDELWKEERAEFDAEGRTIEQLTRIRNPPSAPWSERHTTWRFDERGRVIEMRSEVDGLTSVETIEYDDAARSRISRRGDGERVRTLELRRHDALGREIEEASDDDADGVFDRRVARRFDAAGNRLHLGVDEDGDGHFERQELAEFGR